MFKTIMTALAISAVEAASDKKCRAVALSGGGSNGAWEMGVLYGFTHYGNPSDFAYDVVTGISAGSINAIQLMSYAVGDEVNATE